MGRVCEVCAAPLTGAQRKYCSQRCNKRAWRARGDNRERDLAARRAWKAANAERMRAYHHEYARRVAGTCVRCGGRMGAGIAQDGVCRDCQAAVRRQRALRIVSLWDAGRSLREIADELGMTPGYVGSEMHRLRGEGYDLPYRRPRVKAAD